MVKTFYQKSGLSQNVSSNSKSWHPYITKEKMKGSIFSMLSFSSLLIIVNNIDIVLVKYYTTSEMTGFYSAFNITGKIIFWINSAITTMLLPYACAEEEKGLNTKIYLYGYATIFTIGFLAIGFYSLFPEQLIYIMFGKKYIGYSNLLWLFGINGLCFSLFFYEANLAFAKKKYGISFLLIALILGFIYFVSVSSMNLHQIITSFIQVMFGGYVIILIINVWGFFTRRS